MMSKIFFLVGVCVNAVSLKPVEFENYDDGNVSGEETKVRAKVKDVTEMRVREQSVEDDGMEGGGAGMEDDFSHLVGLFKQNMVDGDYILFPQLEDAIVKKRLNIDDKIVTDVFTGVVTKFAQIWKDKKPFTALEEKYRIEKCVGGGWRNLKSKSKFRSFLEP